jgi:hypothetical protein
MKGYTSTGVALHDFFVKRIPEKLSNCGDAIRTGYKISDT